VRKITVLDTTLRDGLQSEDISLSLSDKLNIVRVLDDFGIQYIEAGYPYSNPADLQFFKEVKKIKLKHAKLAAFGSTRRKNIKAEEDAALAALLNAETPTVTVFGKSVALHVEEVLRVSLQENLDMIYDTVRFLKAGGKEVIFDAEHFFDGYAGDKVYALKAVDAALSAGADIICLCDTNGGFLPRAVYDTVKEVTSARKNAVFGIHAHNDSACAVANTLTAAEAGALHIQGTFIGYGERCGNADLSSVLPGLALKLKIDGGWDLAKLTDAATEIAEFSNVSLDARRPYSGRSAFAHKAGVHADGVLKNPLAYEHIDPAAVGNKRRFLISATAGKSLVYEKIKDFAPNLAKNGAELDGIVTKIKEMEGLGYLYEAAEASLELLVKKELGLKKKYFNVKFYKSIGEFPVAEGELAATATVKVEVGGKSEMTAASGRGPVNALDLALRKALSVFYPAIGQMHLTDYKVRVLEQEQNAATAAKVRVLIESADGKNSWTTVGVSDDIIEASLAALIDSIEYKLSREQ